MPILEKELKMLLGDKLDESGANQLGKICMLAGGELGGTGIVDRPKSVYSIRYKKAYLQ